jgi:hypothetical protein
MWVLMSKTAVATRLSKSEKVYDLLAHFYVHDVVALNTYQLGSGQPLSRTAANLSKEWSPFFGQLLQIGFYCDKI